MRKETIDKALAHLPATRAELAERLGVKEAQANSIAKHLLEQRYAEEWDSKPTAKGTLARILCTTGKVPV